MDQSKTQSAQEAKLHFLDYWRIIRIRKTVILAVFLLVVITATLVTFILTEKFTSKTRIKIERDAPDIAGLVSQQMPMAYDPYFIQTEFEVIQSELILNRVIEDLDLNRKWGKKVAGADALKTSETMMLLRGNMDLRPTRNTSLIEISVWSESAQEASDIANKIAESYKDHRQKQRRDASMRGIDSLEKRFVEQAVKIKEKQTEVERLRTDLNIPDMMASENGGTMLMTAETLRKFETLRIESQAEFVRQDTLLTRLKKLPPDELAQAIPTAAQDPLLSSLLEQLTLAEQKLVVARKDYGPEHAEVLKLGDQVKDLQTKITKRVQGILIGLDARVASLKEGLENLKREVESSKQLDIQEANRSRPYFEAKRELEEMQRFRQLLNAKLYAERTDVDLPTTGVVEIVDKAKPSLRPSKPNKPLNIALGVIIGLVVGVGLAFFIEYLDTSVKTIDDVERALGAPVLGVIPQNVGVLLDEGVESPHAEAYRVLRTNLLFSRKDDKLNTCAVVSAGAGEGKSTTVFNLAAVFAQSGSRVLVVDSDLRRPTLHKMLKVSNSIGLTNLLLRQNKLEEVVQRTTIPTLDFMPSGKLPSSSLGILSSLQMKELITELKQHYDFVFFDSPPVMGVSDASILASEVDMVVQVIQYRRYPQPMNIRAKQMIEKVGGNLMGIVLNNINMSQDESYYYYSGYYHDYYSRNEDQDPAAAGKEKDKDGKPPGDQAKLEIKKKY
jgi:capsular exopolysaccharide synthesis family protein